MITETDLRIIGTLIGIVDMLLVIYIGFIRGERQR